jgi:hypothetical protein
LGAAGVPAQLFGLVIGLWWAVEWLAQPWPRSTLVQPLKRCALLFLAAVLASYLASAVRPISPDEQLPSDRTVLNVIAWLGLMTAAMDGITTRAGLETLLRRLPLLGGFEAAVGILQQVTGLTLVEYLHLPGLADSGVGEGLAAGGPSSARRGPPATRSSSVSPSRCCCPSRSTSPSRTPDAGRPSPDGFPPG